VENAVAVKNFAEGGWVYWVRFRHRPNRGLAETSLSRVTGSDTPGPMPRQWMPLVLLFLLLCEILRGGYPLIGAGRNGSMTGSLTLVHSRWQNRRQRSRDGRGCSRLAT